MADDQIRYDLLVQDALRGVVRKVLGDAARDGLHGEHHFYVSFNTQAPGVRMSQRLREKYPQDMTIVLQHQFWDLGVTEHTFEVGLSFSGVPERLLVPFEAVTGFFDPSVQFGLKFEPQDGSEAEDDDSQSPPIPNNGLRAIRGAASEPSMTPPKVPALAPVSSGVPKLATAPNDSRKPGKDADPPKKAAQEPAKGDSPAEAPEAGAEVVSLDSFRKKN